MVVTIQEIYFVIRGELKNTDLTNIINRAYRVHTSPEKKDHIVRRNPNLNRNL
jgi:hypothetical protein